MLVRLEEIHDARRRRLLANDIGVPPVLWSVLVAGGVITVGFTYFFGIKNFRAQALMVTALTTMIGLIMFLILAIDYPFSGTVTIAPEAFEQVKELLADMARHPGTR
jgi:hypothetical protein